MSWQRTFVTFAALAVLVIALPAGADVGSFQSFTVTAMHPTDDSIQWDITLQTQGAASPTDDVVLGGVGYSRIDAPAPLPPTNSYFIPLFRTSPTDSTFTGTYTATGLDPRIDYKWGAGAAYISGELTNAAGSQLDSWYLSVFYYTGIPFFYSFINTATTITNVWNTDAPGGAHLALRLGRTVSQGRGIPTTSAVGVVLLGLLMMGAGILVMRRS